MSSGQFGSREIDRSSPTLEAQKHGAAGHAKWVVSEASETRRPHHRRLPPHKTAATRAGLSVSSRQRGSIIATKRPMARGLSTACGRRHLSLAPSVILRAGIIVVYKPAVNIF